MFYTYNFLSIHFHNNHHSISLLCILGIFLQGNLHHNSLDNIYFHKDKISLYILSIHHFLYYIQHNSHHIYHHMFPHNNHLYICIVHYLYYNYLFQDYIHHYNSLYILHLFYLIYKNNIFHLLDHIFLIAHYYIHNPLDNFYYILFQIYLILYILNIHYHHIYYNNHCSIIYLLIYKNYHN